MLHSDQPIGIFDSGVGGLTVANAIRQILPEEQMIYFGDTAHLPYGDKSNEAIIFYSTKISRFLLEKKCKVILIACNSASATAFNAIKELVQDQAIVINVIDPVVDYVVRNYRNAKIGVIGTKATINSGTYEIKIIEQKAGIRIASLATPLFVPMIEEGFIYDDISNAIIRNYLSRDILDGINTLILGCTHYPIIKNQIKKFYNFKVDVVDSGQIVANFLRDVLQKNKLLNNGSKSDPVFYISDFTDYFLHISKMFFEEEIHLEKMDFWK